MLALTYNVNRGKAEPLTWKDFFPFTEERRHVKPPDISKGIPPIFEAMQKAMNNGK